MRCAWLALAGFKLVSINRRIRRGHTLKIHSKSKPPENKVEPQARRTSARASADPDSFAENMAFVGPGVGHRCVRRRSQWYRDLLASGRPVWIRNAVVDAFLLSHHVRDSRNQRAHWPRDGSRNLGQYPQNVSTARGLLHRGHAAGFQCVQSGRRFGSHAASPLICYLEAPRGFTCW